VGIFATRAKRSTDGPGATTDLPEALRRALPQHFEAVGEAVASGPASESVPGSGSTGSSPVSIAACGEAGRVLARAGVSLGEALDGLWTTVWMVRRREPDHPEVRALSVAWSEVTLGYLNRLSCMDPLTGLATQAHVQGRLAEVYRDPGPEESGVRRPHALVVVEARAQTGSLEHAARLTQLGELGRTVFPAADTIARVGPRRVVVLTARDDRLARRVSVLRRMLDNAHPDARVWIEGLPDAHAAAEALLEELART
jgi:hypothetical protein